MKRSGLLIIIAILFTIIMLVITGFNNFIEMEESTSATYGQVQTLIQKKADMVPRIIQTIKETTKVNDSLLIQVTDARSNIIEATTPEELATANKELDEALADLSTVVDAIPEMKQNEAYNQFQEKIINIENRLFDEKASYNQSVKIYNEAIRKFPTLLFADLMGFTTKQYFEVKTNIQQ